MMGRPVARAPVYPTTVRALSEAELRQRLSGAPEEAARWIQAAALGGSGAAQVTLGQMLLDGYGLKRDMQAAFRWFGIAAAGGDLDGLNMLGRCYELGWGVTSDRAKALACYRRAAARSHAWAQFNLAMLMLHGPDGTRHVRAALALLVRSARQGNAKAMNMLGRYREFGWVGAIKMAAARRWYRRAAERGCFRAAAHLARLLCADGLIREGTLWYRSSAQAAPVHFCRALAAELLDNPHPALRDVGLYALKCAAESGEPGDLFRYGQALAFGEAGPVDFDEAAIWLHRAEVSGMPGAMALLTDARRRRVG